MSTQKVWFITGASKGMGLEVVKAVLNNGDKVIATSRSTDGFLESLGENDKNILPLIMDVTSEQEVKDVIIKSIEAFGRIDVVVNNAGYNLLGNIEELSDSEFRETMDVNLFGMANVIRHILPHLRRQKSGHIINTSSMMGYMSYSGNGSYSAQNLLLLDYLKPLPRRWHLLV